MLARFFILLILAWPATVLATDVVDATGRTVVVPDGVARVLPAGPPAAVLLEAIAPDLMLGWPSPVPENARAMLAPAAATRPLIPRLTGREDVTDKIQALKPDLILDYGTVSPRYAALARTTQQRTGVPTLLLDGSLPEIPRTLRLLGAILHREGRAETLARFAEALLAMPSGPNARIPNARSPNARTDAHPRVVYARGADGLSLAAAGTEVTDAFARAGWQVLAPDGQGPFRQASIEAIRTLDPDILIFAEPTMRDAIARTPAWQTVRAVREGQVYFAPSQPFGWLEEPPSINRLLGLAWLAGADPATLAQLFNAVVYGRVLRPAQTGAILAGVRPIQP